MIEHLRLDDPDAKMRRNWSAFVAPACQHHRRPKVAHGLQVRPPLASHDAFENRAKDGVDTNLGIEVVDEQRDSILGDAVDFHVDFRDQVRSDRQGGAGRSANLI